MKTILAVALVCGALAGFAMGASKPSHKATDRQQRAKPAPAKRSALVAPIPDHPSNSSAKGSDADLAAADATSDTPAPAPATSAADLAPPAPVESKPSGVISGDIGGPDLQFLFSAFEEGNLQLFLGELARTKAETNQVKALGDVLSSTQREENGKLIRLATMKGVTMPDAEPAGKKAVAAKLEKLNGPKFDKTVMEEIVNVTERAVATFEAAANTKDGDIKAFIEEGLPLAKEKLLLANKMTGNARRSDQAPGFRAQPTAPDAE